MSNFILTYKLTLTCAWLVYLTCTCTPIKKCKPFLQLRASLDTSDVLTEEYLNQFRCNTILKKMHVCCPHEKLPLMPDYVDNGESTRFETVHNKPNSFVLTGIPDMRDRFGDSDYEDRNVYKWLGDQPEYYHHHDPGVREFRNGNSRHNHEESWGMFKHTHDQGFKYGPERWNIHGNVDGFSHQHNPDFTGIPEPGEAFNNNNKPRNIPRGTPHHVSHHSATDNSLNFNNKHGLDAESHINRDTTEKDNRDFSEYTTPKTRTWMTTEQTTVSSQDRGIVHGNRFDYTTRRSGWKPQKQTTPSSREDSTTKKHNDENTTRGSRRRPQQQTTSSGSHGDSTTQRGWKTEEQTTSSSGARSTTKKHNVEDATRGRRRPPQQQTTLSDSLEDSTTQRDWKTEEQTTSSSRAGSTTKKYNVEDTTRGKRRRPQQQTTPSNSFEDTTTWRDWKTEERTTSSSQARGTTKKYDVEGTTREKGRRPQQQTTPSGRDEGKIIFEDSFETSTSRNSWNVSEQTTLQATDDTGRNNQNGRRNCETPEKKTGICTKQSDCQPYLNLQNNLDKSKESVRDYLDRFRCNSSSTREMYVCCQIDEEKDIDNSVFNAERTDENIPEPISEICGRQTANTDKIFGGTTADLGEFPWIALLQYPSDNGLMSGCGGTLINSRYILTAAHCVDDDILKRRKLQPLRQVILGEYDTRNETDCIYMPFGQDCALPPKTYGVESIVPHNLYSSDTTRHDIALVRLSQEVTFTDYIKPICLPTNTSTINGNETFIIAGWGRTPTETSSPVLNKAKVPFAQKQDCNVWNTNSRTLIDGQICVGRGNGTDSCNGDSGGPLMLEVNFNFELVTHLVGIISYGFGECGTAPSVNTYVPFYIDWINDNIR